MHNDVDIMIPLSENLHDDMSSQAKPRRMLSPILKANPRSTFMSRAPTIYDAVELKPKESLWSKTKR